MNSISALIYGRRASLAAGLIALIYFVLLGFRGFGKSSMAWLESAVSLNQKIVESPTSALRWSAEPGVLADIIGALAIFITPGSPGWALVWLSAVAAGLSTTLLFLAAHRLAGPLGGWASLFFILTCAPWMGVFTRAEPTSLLVPLFLGFILIWHSGARWWIRSAMGAPVLAAAVLLWPGALLLPAALLIVDLTAPLLRTPSGQPGLTAAPVLSLDRLLTPLSAFLLLLCFPLFWPDPVAELGAYFFAALEVLPPELVFRGEVYPPARPPFYFGAAWIAEQLPFITVAALMGGIFCSLVKGGSEERRLVLSLTFIAAALLTFPVLFRGPRPLGAEFGVLFLAVALPLASMASCRFFSYALGEFSPSMKIRQIAIGTFVVAGISIVVEVPRSLAIPEAYRSPLTARLVGWSPSADMPLRHEILPLNIIDASAPGPEELFYSRGWEKHLEAYRSMGLIENVQTTPDAASATIFIRTVPAVAAARFGSYDAPYSTPLPDAQTVLVPELHRPVFFIDRRR